jgi:hypothetical protein
MRDLIAERPWPRRQEARGLQVALVLVGFVGLIVGAYLTGPMFIWLSVAHRPHSPVPFPVVSLLGLVVPAMSIALGIWAWRGRRVRKLIALYPIVGGAVGLGLGIAVGMVVLAISFAV